MVRVAMAGLLKGYSVAELGFDPMVVPGWITTALPSQVVRDLALSPNPLAELGLLVDGITDVGFRNVLNTAKRDFQLRVDPGVLQQALAGNNAPSSLPSLTNLGTGSLNAAPKPAPTFGTPTGGAMRVEPSAPPTSFTPPQPSMPLSTAAPGPVFSPQAVENESPSPFLVPSTASKPLFAPAAKDPFSVPAASAASPFGAGMGTPPASKHQDFMADSPTRQEVPMAVPVPSLLTPASGNTSQAAEEARSCGDGFGSDQLLGRVSSSTASWNEAAVTSAVGESPVFPLAKEAPLIELPTAKPLLDEPAEPDRGWVASPATRPFIAPKFDDMLPPVPVEEEPPRPRKPSPPPLPRAAANGSSSNVGVQAHDADPDQIVLRALLDTDSDLEPQKVVELTCRLPGIAACVCLHDGRAISHVGAHKPQAREFQKQATQLAQHLKTLAPLIGIDGAETFTMNSGDRLMTFCFPDRAILGVLHDAEPTLGLRDKITLIARELSRMVS